MICRNCGNDLPNDSTFCPYCGTKNEIEYQMHENMHNNPSNEKKKKRALVPVIILVFVIVIACIIPMAREWNATNSIESWRSEDGKSAYEYFAGNVFQVIVKDLSDQPIATGSAFVFNSDGWFVTNAHVLEDAYYAEAIFNIPNNKTGEFFTYLDINEGTYYHLDKDIYIGKLDGYDEISAYYNEIPLCLEYEIGDKTYSVGYPDSSTELIINEGYITENWSDLYEKLYSGNSYICSSSNIEEGSSGGILVNKNLEVLGITTLGWFDDDDEFINGASISAFNFKNLLETECKGETMTLVDRFHSEEYAFIGLYNEAKEDAVLGDCVETSFDDGTVGYVYDINTEGTTAEGSSCITKDRFVIGCDGYMEYETEDYWDSGERRIQAFYGYYDGLKKFEDFEYEFEYQHSDGTYYTASCTDINYSENIDLTLNKCTIDDYNYEISWFNMIYVKESFNSVYEAIAGLIERHE